MKTQIHELRTRIDGLSQLVESLMPKHFDSKNDEFKEGFHSSATNAAFLNTNLKDCYKSLLLSKAWLGKVLAELGEETPYKTYPVGVVGKTSRDAFFLAVEKGLDTKNRKECILISTPVHFKSWVFSELILPSDLSVLSEEMQMAVKHGKEQVFVDSTSFPGDSSTIKFLFKELTDGKSIVGEFEMNYIEKIDWLREEIESFPSINVSSLSKYAQKMIEFSAQHLTEARFFLGFELSHIKEQSK